MVTEQPWYQGGYRANVVAYAIAKLAHDVEVKGLAVDFDRIWKTQTVSEPMKQMLISVSEQVHDVLTSPPSGISNVTEWAKQQACWARVKALVIDWPDEWLADLIGKDEQRAIKKSAVKDQKMLYGIEAQSAAVNAGGQFWSQIADWGRSKKLLTPTEAGILAVAASIPNRIPTERQSVRAVEILRKLRSEGCVLSEHISI